MTDTIYTALTFAPVQGFIEKSRKLRDLYGSSFILSYLARALCQAAENKRHEVISPATVNVVQGTPNQIIIKGAFAKADALATFNHAWKTLAHTCRQWIEGRILAEYCWHREWELWANHAWEFFWAQGTSITQVRKKLNDIKRSRNWIGINWMGESSTLSGADAIAWPGMGQGVKPQERNLGVEDEQIRRFYTQMSQLQPLGEAFVDPREQLSIPELMKRLMTYDTIASQLNLSPEELPSIVIPKTFRELNRLGSKPEENRWTGWFQGDGDSIGKYLKSLTVSEANEAKVLNQFSAAMLNWGKTMNQFLPRSTKDRKSIDPDGRIIYAGGDDFLGVLYRSHPDPEMTPQECLDWFYGFKEDVWQKHQCPITVSVGFVWAGPSVPQRDVLQHCREAEKSAKQHGRDRIALRVLFNSGNFIEWVCPWWFLQDVLEGYCDGNGKRGKDKEPNWTHIYNDVATLESRHAFQCGQSEVALALFDVYFPGKRDILNNHLWDKDGKTGILGNRPQDCENIHQTLNDWIINLAKIGFHLCYPSLKNIYNS